MAFVAPEAALPVVVKQFSQDLDPKQMESVGPTEAAIFRTPEGTAYIDVLSKKAPVVIDKNTKDYDTLKWEEELRAQLAQKKGQAKKLSADDQSKVNAQLAKESAIRKEVTGTEHRMRRGVGIIRSLATGPPTEAEQWMGPAVDLLIQAIRAGAGLLLGDVPATALISCSERVSNRLGMMRPFIGVAVLRTIGSIQLASEYEDEDLGGKSISTDCSDLDLADNIRSGNTRPLPSPVLERTEAARRSIFGVLLPSAVPCTRKGWYWQVCARRS